MDILTVLLYLSVDSFFLICFISLISYFCTKELNNNDDDDAGDDDDDNIGLFN
jgi:hypothetical protein